MMEEYSPPENSPNTDTNTSNPIERIYRGTLDTIYNDPCLKDTIIKIGMTLEIFMNNFTPPKKLYAQYCRQMFYDLTEHQMQLLKGIAQFPSSATNLHKSQQILIMFLEFNPIFQCHTYIHLYFRFASYLLEKKEQVRINEIQFSKKTSHPIILQLPGFQNLH